MTTPLTADQREYMRGVIQEAMKRWLHEAEAEGRITRHPVRPLEDDLEDLAQLARERLR